MSKVVSGLILMLIGSMLLTLGRAMPPANTLVFSAIMVVWMVGALTMVIFGFYRIIVGLVTQA